MVCIGSYDITIDELLSGNEGRGKKKLDIAESFIKEYFGAAKEIISNDILQEAARRGIKRNILYHVVGHGAQDMNVWLLFEDRDAQRILDED